MCGISVDGSRRLARFAGNRGLSFALLSDPGGTVASRYGSLVNLGLLKFARRNTFLIDPEGRIAKVYLDASPAHNAAEVVSGLKGSMPA